MQRKIKINKMKVETENMLIKANSEHYTYYNSI